MNRFLDCTVCSATYNTTDKVPKILSCGHSFCASCLGKLLRGSSVCCPHCDTPSQLPDGAIAELPTVCSVVDYIKDICEDCGQKPRVEECDHCDLSVCEECKRRHTEVSGTEYGDLKDLVSRVSGICKDNPDVEVIKSRGEALIKELGKVHQEQIQQVDKRHEELVSIVTDQVLVETNLQLKWHKHLVSDLTNAKLFLDKADTQMTDAEKSTNETCEVQRQSVLRESAKHLASVKSSEKSKPAIPDMSYTYTRRGLNVALLECCQVTFTGRPSQNQSPNYQQAEYSHKREITFGEPKGLCIHPNSNEVIVCDTHNRDIVVYNEDLDALHTFGIEQGKPFDVAVCSDGNIYFSMCNVDVIRIADVKGTFIKHIGDRGMKRFSSPFGLAFDSKDFLYICDTGNKRVTITDKDGEYVRCFGRGVFHEDKPMYIAISKDNIVAASTSSEGNIHLFTTDGSYTTTISGSLPPHNINFNGLTFDREGNVIATDYRGRIVAMTRSGDILALIGGFGQDPGLLNQPGGVVCAPSGDIIVCDPRNSRVQRYNVPLIYK